MASWMVHLRIADRFLDLLDVEKTEFVMGNIAPDSGVPNEDWSAFTPDKELSHFKVRGPDGHRHINEELYINKYFKPDVISEYTSREYSFYLGYLVHLLTDILWIEHVLPLCMSRSSESLKNDRDAINVWKKDFYDLDCKYIRDNPDFRAFNIYKNSKGFLNNYMDFFPPDAFDNRREYIVSFYSAEKYDLDRKYEFYNEKDMSDFIDLSVKNIFVRLEELNVNKL